MSGIDNGNGPQASTALQAFVVTHLTRTYRSVRDARCITRVGHLSGAWQLGGRATKESADERTRTAPPAHYECAVSGC
jgi:hypothetical protein